MGATRLKTTDLTLISTQADQSIGNQTTLQDVIGLVATLKPNTKYLVYVNGRMNSPTAADIKMTFTVISGAEYAEFVDSGGAADLKAFGVEEPRITTGNKQTFILTAHLKTGPAGGIVQLQYAQDVSNAGQTTIYEGSLFRLYELP